MKIEIKYVNGTSVTQLCTSFVIEDNCILLTLLDSRKMFIPLYNVQYFIPESEPSTKQIIG